MEGSRFNNAVQIGTTAFITLAAAVGLYVVGIGHFTGAVETEGNVVASGSVVVDATGGAVRIGASSTRPTTTGYARGIIVGTGGLQSGKYNTCLVPFPSDQLVGSGAVVDSIDVDITAAPLATPTLNCGFVASTANSGALAAFTHKAISTGAVLRFSTGAVVWQKTDTFKCSAGVNPTAQLAGVCKILFHDRSGS